MHYATRAGHLDIVDLLVTAGADHRVVNKKGETALTIVLASPKEVVGRTILDKSRSQALINYLEGLRKEGQAEPVG